MSKDEVAETIHSLMTLLGKLDDKKLKGELENQIIRLCDQLKSTMIIDRIKERKANEK